MCFTIPADFDPAPNTFVTGGTGDAFAPLASTGTQTRISAGAVATGVFGFIYFAMVNTGSLPLIFFAIILSLVPHDMLYGPRAALIAESFTGRPR